MRTLKEHLKMGKFAPIYLFYGEEGFLLEFYLKKNCRQPVG